MRADRQLCPEFYVLRNDIIALRQHLNFFVSVFVEEPIETRQLLFDSAPEAHQIIFRVLWRDLLMRCTRLFDKSKSGQNLCLEFVVEEYASELPNDFKERVREARPDAALKKIERIRHKFIGHRDREHAIQEDPPPNVELEAVQVALEHAHDILNQIASALGTATLAKSIYRGDDAGQQFKRRLLDGLYYCKQVQWLDDDYHERMIDNDEVAQWEYANHFDWGKKLVCW